MVASKSYGYAIAVMALLGCAQPGAVSPPLAPPSPAPDAASPPVTISAIAADAALGVAEEAAPVNEAPAQPLPRRECSGTASPALRVSAARGRRTAVTLGGELEPRCPHTLGADLGAFDRAPGGYPSPGTELVSIFRVDW